MDSVKFVFDSLGPLLAALIGVIGANYLVPKAQDHWDKIKKQRDLDLIAVEEFHRLYGEFFAVWKLWSATFRQDSKFERSAVLAQECLVRATAIEGGVESLLVKMSADRRLTNEQVDVLGASRQAFQSLRKVIQNHESLNWTHAEEPHYTAFKVLATYMSGLLAKYMSGLLANSPDPEVHPTAEQAAANLRLITSNIYEECSTDAAKRWVTVGARLAHDSHRTEHRATAVAGRTSQPTRLTRRDRPGR